MPDRETRTMSPETSRKIESILRRIMIHMDIANPRGGCFVCGVVTVGIRQSIERDLSEQFRADFHGCRIEFV
jgi:hypothetical protein